MRTWFDRRTGLAVASLILLGWTLGSTLMPPVVRTEAQPPAVPVRRIEPSAVPRVLWPPRRSVGSAPRVGRNPFAFERADTPAASVPRGDTAAAPPRISTDEPSDAQVEPRTEWRLAGLAAGPGDGFTAILSGNAGVQLARAGDSLPDGGRVLEVTADRVRVADAAGTERVLVLR